MYEYKFKKVYCDGMIKNKPCEDYQEIICEHAKKGWRLVQIFSPAVFKNGSIEYFELIFEREVV